MNSRESGGPNPQEIMQPKPEEQVVEAKDNSSLTEDLKEKRKRLEERVAKAKEQKEQDIANKLTEREAMVKEDRSIVPLLQEAEETLEYFEKQNQNGLLTKKEDLAELESLRETVADLRSQREASLQKYESIMNNPDVYSKVVEEATKENTKREKEKTAEVNKEATEQELNRRVEEISKSIEEYINQLVNAFDKKIRLDHERLEKSDELIKIIKNISKSLNFGETRNFLERFPKIEGIEDLTKIEEHRKSLGLFKLKEKSVVDQVLKEKDKFIELDELQRRISEQKQAYQEIKNQIGSLKKEYDEFIEFLYDARKILNKETNLINLIEMRIENDIVSRINGTNAYGGSNKTAAKEVLGYLQDGTPLESY